MGYRNAGRQNAWATRFLTVAPNICGCSARNLRHVTLLAPSILRYGLGFPKIRALLVYGTRLYSCFPCCRLYARALAYACMPTPTYIPRKMVKWSRYSPGVAQRVGRGIALLFHDRGTRRWWVVSSTPRPHFTPGKESVPILQEAGWHPGPVWKGGKSRPHRDSIQDRPARSQSLYRLSYPAHVYTYEISTYAWRSFVCLYTAFI